MPIACFFLNAAMIDEAPSVKARERKILQTALQ